MYLSSDPRRLTTIRLRFWLQEATTEHEIYPNTPLRYVAFEVRFPLCPELNTEMPPAAVHEVLRKRFPLPRPEPHVTFAGTTPSVITRHRLLDREQRSSVLISPTGLVIDTTDYPSFEDFRETVADAVRALATAVPLDGIERVGLRYIDEIRVDGIADALDWGSWIEPRVLAPLRLDESRPPADGIESVIRYGTAPGYVTLMRLANLEGRTVDPNGPLAVPDVGGGPYFLIDIDSSWADPDRRLPEFDPERVLSITSELHVPVHALFEAAITDRYRNEVLRMPRKDRI